MNEASEYSQSAHHQPVLLGRLTPWLPVHEQALDALQNHLLSLEGSMHAARGALARRFNAYPLKLEADWGLMLGQQGALLVVALGDAASASFHDWLRDSPAEAAQWRTEVWCACVSVLPHEFANLEATIPAD